MHLHKVLNLDVRQTLTSIHFSVSATVQTIRGVAGRNVSLPCDILQQPRDVNDAVAMVLWFKEASGEPLYRYISHDPYIDIYRTAVAFARFTDARSIFL